MEQLWLTMSSVTYAMKAQKLLEQNGYHAGVGKAPVSPGSRGCGYSLRVRASEGSGAKALLGRAGIQILGERREGV